MCAMTEAGDQVDRSTVMHDPRLLLLASLAGMGAVVVFPLAMMAPLAVVAPLLFALPLLLVVIARMRGLPWLRTTALLLMVVVALVLVPGIEVPGVVPVALIALGPIVAVVTVGAPLREVDVPAAAGFLLSGTIAVIAGFAAQGTPGAAWLVVGVAAVGLSVVAGRLRGLPRVVPPR
jgi:hypothetical protein